MSSAEEYWGKSFANGGGEQAAAGERLLGGILPLSCLALSLSLSVSPCSLSLCPGMLTPRPQLDPQT
eukprot:2025846-Rhodomonas_salina.2